MCIFHDKGRNNIISAVHMCVSEVLSWRWSFVVHEEDEMMQKCLICAWKFPVKEAFFVFAVVLDGRCFSYCNVTFFVFMTLFPWRLYNFLACCTTLKNQSKGRILLRHGIKLCTISSCANPLTFIIVVFWNKMSLPNFLT